MMKKIKIMQNAKTKYIFQGLLFSVLFLIFSVYVGREIPWNSNFLEVIYALFTGGIFFSLIIYTLWECDERTQEEYEVLLGKRFFPIRFPKTVTLLILCVILSHRGYLGSIDMKRIYNTNVTYEKSYTQVEQSLLGYYDMTWKTVADKWKISDSAKAAGLEFVKSIYENKKDGQGNGLRLLVESKLIPLEDYNAFYSDLSYYIEAQRKGYYELEKQKQSIVASQAVLLDTFPNNLYNKLLGIKKIEYKYGLLSNKTKADFLVGEGN
jgi:hypothetical protein